MKFLCERCKTRYSIGDDRVRGKILKIRCKNCANVITVREGMDDAGAADDDASPRRNRNTTQAPSAIAQEPSSAKPPPALEEEWYVSIDGDQEGPFSLADAQRWISNKAIDADLHCWSEGFDDWLPVDKVSHFRGLRKKPAAISPPPLPRAATASGGLRSPVSEETPKPLFAATMASLEKSAGITPAPATTGPAPRRDLPSLDRTPRPSATPPGGERAIGAKPATPAGKPAAPEPKVPAKSNGAAVKPLAAKDVFAANDAATQSDSDPFDDPEATVVGPHGAPLEMKGASKPLVSAARADNHVTEAEKAPPGAPSKPLAALDDDAADDDEEDLAIGEVSRVVNLADLMAAGRPKPGAGRANAAGPVQRRSSPVLGAAAGIGRTGPVPRLDDQNVPIATTEAPVEGGEHIDHGIAPAVQETHRRGLFALVGVAGVLLAGVIIAVIILVGGGTGGMTSLGRSGGIDTTRPDDLLRPGGASGTGPAVGPVNPYLPPLIKTPIYRPRNPNTNTAQPDDPGGGNRIGGDEVEAMARAQQGTTQRCYMRAQRGAEQILVGDIKKINVTLEIGTDGVVKSVGLDKAADSGLGRCLQGAIKTWKFRASPGGTYRFALVFSST